MISTRWSWVPLTVNGWWLEVSPHVESSRLVVHPNHQGDTFNKNRRIFLQDFGRKSFYFYPAKTRFENFCSFLDSSGVILNKHRYFTNNLYAFKMVTPNGFQHFWFNYNLKKTVRSDLQHIWGKPPIPENLGVIHRPSDLTIHDSAWKFLILTSLIGAPGRTFCNICTSFSKDAGCLQAPEMIQGFQSRFTSMAAPIPTNPETPKMR